LDDDFPEMFKVKVPFDFEMDRTPENELHYASFIRYVVDTEHLLPLDASAMAAIVEYGSRLVENQEKLSTQFSAVSDLIRESHFWAKQSGSEQVTRDHVYPDAVRRAVKAVEGFVQNPADVLVSFREGYFYGNRMFDRLVTIEATHGSMLESASTAFYMSTEHEAPPYLRSHELLAYFGRSQAATSAGRSMTARRRCHGVASERQTEYRLTCYRKEVRFSRPMGKGT
jgi:hypothetical protein